MNYIKGNAVKGWLAILPGWRIVKRGVASIHDLHCEWPNADSTRQSLAIVWEKKPARSPPRKAYRFAKTDGWGAGLMDCPWILSPGKD
ncbi:hypothetical protein FDZ74_12950 [bacterium]|nr:MAG: hypothetical protein FDZ74_12950 [bacterium]